MHCIIKNYDVWMIFIITNYNKLLCINKLIRPSSTKPTKKWPVYTNRRKPFPRHSKSLIFIVMRDSTFFNLSRDSNNSSGLKRNLQLDKWKHHKVTSLIMHCNPHQENYKKFLLPNLCFSLLDRLISQ